MFARPAPATSPFPSIHRQTHLPALVHHLLSWPTPPATAQLDRSTMEPHVDARLLTATAATPTEHARNAPLVSCSVAPAVSTHALLLIVAPVTHKVNALPARVDSLPALTVLLVYLAPILLDARAVNPTKIAQSAPQA